MENLTGSLQFVERSLTTRGKLLSGLMIEASNKIGDKKDFGLLRLSK